MKDILQDQNGDILISNGDVVIGESDLQEVGEIIQANPGDIKNDPIIGVGLNKYIKGKVSNHFVEAEVKTHLKRDDKNYNQIKKQILITKKTN